MMRNVTGAIRLGLLCLAATATLAIAGCGGGGSGDTSTATPKAGGTLRVSQGEEVITLDPLQITDLWGVNVISQINETLFKASPEGKSEPWLVSRVKKSDGDRVLTLYLRKGVEFSDGKPMTSADVLFTLEQARKSANWESILSGIEKVEAPSPSTIVITNGKPAPELEAALSQWSFGIVPKNYGGVSEKEYGKDPIGTGPFMLGPWKHGESLTLEKNPHYWQKGQPYLDKIVFQTVPDTGSRVAQFKGGQLDLIYSPPWAELESIEHTPELRVGNYPLGFTEFLILNARSQLFKAPKVREAVNLAIDREGILGAVTAGYGEPAGSWLSPAVPFHDAGIKAPARGPARARQLLAEAVKGGADPSFTLATTSGNSFWEAASQIVQQDLQEVGFHVKLQQYDAAALEEQLQSNSSDAAAIEFYDAVPSPSEQIGFYNGFEGVWSGADTTKTTKLAEQASTTPSPRQRERYWLAIQRIIAEEKFLVPVVYLPYVWAYHSDVAGFQIGTTGVPWFAETGFSK